jgi:hypothetical protein
MITVVKSYCPQNHPCPTVRLCPTGAIIQRGNAAPEVDPRQVHRLWSLRVLLPGLPAGLQIVQ